MTGKKAAGMENTLDAESTIRIHYLRDRIRSLYYANYHIGQDVTLDGTKNAETSHASPEATLKIMAYARHLFLEIWQTEMLVDPIGKILERAGVEGHPRLGELIEQDPDVAGLVEQVRQRFSVHPDFTIKEAIDKIEATGFDRFWMGAQRILMFRDAVSAVTYTAEALDEQIRNAGKASILPARSLTAEERRRLEKRYRSDVYDVDWKNEKSMQVFQESVACLGVLMDEHRVSTSLHRCYRTQETMERLVAATYSLKYVIQGVHDFICAYRGLGIPTSKESPTEPELFAREKRYLKYRNKYASHRDDEHVPSVMLVFGDSAFVSELARDVEEIMILSRRLCPGYRPTARIALPTRERAARMDKEMDDLRLQTYGWLGDRLANSEYEKKCDELRGAVAAAHGLR